MAKVICIDITVHQSVMIECVFNRNYSIFIFDNLLACGNHLGLLSEDIDFSTKRLLGNFPQAYSHLALINTAKLFSEEKYVSKFIKP